MKSSIIVNLPDILREKVLPWAQQREPSRLIVSGPGLKLKTLPEGVKVFRQKLKGKRTPHKGTRLYSDHSTIAAHWHKDHLIEMNIPTMICVVEGEARLQFGEHLFQCPSGNFIWGPPGIARPRGQNRPHMDEAAQRAGKRCDLLWFERHHRSLHCWLCHSEGTAHRHNTEQNYYLLSPRNTEIFDLMADEIAEQREGYEVILANLLHTLILVLMRDLEEGRYLHPGFVLQDEGAEVIPDKDDPIKTSQHYVRTHLSDALTIDIAARQAHMSRTLFTRRFREQTGQSFVEFVTTCRLEEARALLVNSQWSITIIATYVGFRSASHFHEMFRRDAGITPIQFREQQRMGARGRS